MISGKSFSEICKWVVDNRYPDRAPFKYSSAQSGDWVFVNGDFLSILSSTLPFLAVKKFVFIVHNTDRSFGVSELRVLLPHALKVYAINTTVEHPLLVTIPIGFVDRQLPFLREYIPKHGDRDIEVYMNFTTVTNVTKRKECATALGNDPRVVVRTNLTVPEYYTDLCRSKYALCPEGTGIDTHRVYEAMLCGATPIVLRNSLSHMYEKLPVCIVDSWKDVFHTSHRNVFSTNVREYL
jgi:hypothetical protein